MPECPSCGASYSGSSCPYCARSTRDGDSYIQPTEYDRSGRVRERRYGDMGFYTYDDDSGYSEFTPAVGDKVYLYYGMSDNPENPFESYFNFETVGNGSKATAERMDYNLVCFLFYYEFYFLNLYLNYLHFHFFLNFYY